jgi:AbiV family abortive infection protein
LENARALLDEAFVLMEAKHRARAVALAILALEEGDKPRQLLLLTMGQETAKKQWGAFRAHGPKLAASLSLLTHGDYSLLQKSWAGLKPKRGHSSTDMDLAHVAQVLRERCIHADLLSDGTWSIPNRTISAMLVEAFVGAACLQLMLTSTLPLLADRALGGQAEDWFGKSDVDWDSASPRGRRWLRWRASQAGRAWSEEEWARHSRWVEESADRMNRVLRSTTARRAPAKARGARRGTRRAARATSTGSWPWSG